MKISFQLQIVITFVHLWQELQVVSADIPTLSQTVVRLEKGRCAQGLLLGYFFQLAQTRESIPPFESCFSCCL